MHSVVRSIFLTFLNHIRDIKDPEHPYSLEELKVITEDAIEIDDKRSYVRYSGIPFHLFFFLPFFYGFLGLIVYLTSPCCTVRLCFTSGLRLLLQLNIVVWQR